MAKEAWLEGTISIESALQGQSRPLHAVYVRQGKWNRSIHRLIRAVTEADIPVERVDADFIAERVRGSSHGGVIARVGARRFRTLEDLLPATAVPAVVMLDGIEDPFNFGQAIRALYAAGVDGVVVRPRNWTTAAGVVARSSAGASELIPMAVAETAEAAAVFYRERGLLIAATTMQDSLSIYETDLKRPLFLLIGGERRGITRSFLDQADLRLRIPYGREFPRSLGAAASTAILAFEIKRQRSSAGLN